MSTLTATYPTLLDFKARLDPNDKVASVIELLAQQNESIQDIPWKEGNQLTGEVTTVRTGLPAPTWRKLYGGVQPGKSTTAKVTESCGMLEQYAVVDKALADLNNNSAAWRMSEEVAFIEAMNQEFTKNLFYGNEATDAERFTGFAPRFNLTTAANGQNILTSASPPDSTDNASIWLVVWGPYVHGIYPKGSKAGISIEDKGQITHQNIDGSGGMAEVYMTHYRWDVGLAVRDWRYVVRINYDLENIVKSGATGPVLADLMGKALRRVPSLNNGRPVFYANRDTLDALDLQTNNMPLLAFRTTADAQGSLVTTFRGVPIRRVDQLLSTEAGVS